MGEFTYLYLHLFYIVHLELLSILIRKYKADFQKAQANLKSLLMAQLITLINK